MQINLNNFIVKTSFAKNIKNELSTINYSTKELANFIFGVLITSDVKGNDITIKINDQIFSNFIQDCLVELRVDFALSSKNKNYIICNKNNQIINRMSKIDNISFFLGGTFFASGSISKLESNSYHLELSFYAKEKADYVLKIINSIKFENQKAFNFSQILRAHKYVLYTKKSMEIADFIKTTQASESVLMFETKRIERDMFNYTNRYTNLDYYNSEKVVSSQSEFEYMYNQIIEKKLLNKFNQKELNFFKLKSNNANEPLSTLATMYTDKYGIIKTKSALNHWIIKLRRITDDL